MRNSSADPLFSVISFFNYLLCAKNVRSESEKDLKKLSLRSHHLKYSWKRINGP